MTRTLPRIVAAGLLLGLALAACSSATRTPASSGVQPAGGEATVSPADVHFMSGMIVHHAQAVLIAGWAHTHYASPAVRALCERIVVAQQDEIAFMQRWLRERHEMVPDADPRGQMMPGMDHPRLMPGMLTPEQMAQLDSARGPGFDPLFLTFMIQHHQGAITMVQQLLGTQGGAQDGLVFRFAADVNADQTIEIDRMSRMLAALP